MSAAAPPDAPSTSLRKRKLTAPWPFLYSVDSRGLVVNVPSEVADSSPSAPPTKRAKKPAKSAGVESLVVKGIRY
jgi:hypothetical protein